jgi:O-phospho-L-seryl-tRNASec:L-selenocysteinyl-tRNA synthase
MGKKGLLKLLKERKMNFVYAKELITEIGRKYGQAVLNTPHNPISLAVALTQFKNHQSPSEQQLKVQDPKGINNKLNHFTYFGSYLYKRRVSGIRVIATNHKEVCGIQFTNYGSHTSNYKHLPYFSFAIPVGVDKQQVFFNIFSFFYFHL